MFSWSSQLRNREEISALDAESALREPEALDFRQGTLKAYGQCVRVVWISFGSVWNYEITSTIAPNELMNIPKPEPTIKIH